MTTEYEKELQRIKSRAQTILRLAKKQARARQTVADCLTARPAPTPSTWDNLGNILAPIGWDWPGWLPRGFLTILASEPGAGKSLLCLHLAATYIESRPWPDGAPFPNSSAATDDATDDDASGVASDSFSESGRVVSNAGSVAVLWCESESSHALNLQRARRWGVDLSRILAPLKSPLHNVNLNDDGHATALLALARRDDVRLIILDSLRGLLSGPGPRSLGDHLRFLADVARISGKPVLLTHHLRKRVTYDHAGNLTLDQVLGAGAVTQVARIIWAIDTPDPADPGHRRLATIKNNLAPFPDPLGFRVGQDGLHFGPAPQPPTGHTELDRALDFLRQQLADGPLPANQIQDARQAAGLARRTVRRAKRRLAIRSVRPNGESEWYWQLPKKK